MLAKEITVDQRGRTSLARVRSRNHDRYLAEELPNGTLVLTPAVTISTLELAILQDQEAMRAIRRAKSGDRSGMHRGRRPRREA